MRNMKSQTLYVFLNALLQLSKSISFSWPIIKNAKPRSKYIGFVVFKSNLRDHHDQSMAYFWLKYNTFALK